MEVKTDSIELLTTISGEDCSKKFQHDEIVSSLVGIKGDEEKTYLEKFMILPKLAYFFEGAKNGSLLPFLTIFFKSIGMSSSQAGSIRAAGWIGFLLGSFFWSTLADKKKSHRLILNIVSISALISINLQPVASLVLGPATLNNCPVFKFTTNLTSRSDINSGLRKHNATLFWILTCLNLIGFSFDGSVINFIDSAVTRKIDASEGKVDYGRQKLYFSIGWAVLSITTSSLIEAQPLLSVSCYVIPFIFYSGSLVLGILTNNLLYKRLPALNLINNTVNKNTNFTFLSSNIIIFYITSLIIGIQYGANASYTMLYVKQLNNSDLLVGIIQFAGSISGVVVYFFSKTLFHLMGNYQSVSIFCCFTWLCRFLLVATVHNPWYFIIGQAAHGLSFSLFLASRTYFFQSIAPARMYTILYGTNWAVLMGSGPIIANFCGGMVYGTYGPQYLFYNLVGISGVWILTLYIFKCKEIS